MKLIASLTSPYVRKVRALIIEAGRQDELPLHLVKTTPLATAAEIPAANPIGKIPALVREDGPALYDSRVITRFLDAEWDLGLYPQARLWDVLTLEATAEGILDSAVSISYERKLRPIEQQSPDWIEAQWGKIASALDAVEDRWMGLLSGPLNMPQIAMACALEYLDFRHDDRQWRDGRPNLAAFQASFGARPSMELTKPIE